MAELYSHFTHGQTGTAVKKEKKRGHRRTGQPPPTFDRPIPQPRVPASQNIPNETNPDRHPASTNTLLVQYNNCTVTGRVPLYQSVDVVFCFYGRKGPLCALQT
jgi:hypothetical protein